jgi:hypothetical protein
MMTIKGKKRKVLFLGKVRKGRSQRSHVGTINQDYVRATHHILTPRDKEMLRILTIFPVATTKHLYFLTPGARLPNGRILAPFYKSVKGEQICRDRIRRLFDYHYVNKCSPQLPIGEGTSIQYVWLDRAGYKLFNKEGRPPKQLTQEYLHHAHILDVYCHFIDLHRRSAIKIDFLHVPHTYKPKTAKIEPDLIVAFQKEGIGYQYFIEVDTGEKKEADEVKKLEKYKEWEYSTFWIREPFAKVYPKRKFPYVMYICTGTNRQQSRRIKALADAAQELKLRGHFLTWDGFVEKIK